MKGVSIFKKVIYLISTSLIAVIVLYSIEQYLQVNYLIKTILKIILFLSIPIIYNKLISKETIISLKFQNSNLKLGVTLGVLSFTSVIISYLIFKGLIDFQSIITDMQTKSKITPANFIFVGLYVTFINSFLEEYFFRGYIFLSFYNSGQKRIAYLYSAVLFAIYHIGIFKTWFKPPLMLLVMFALVLIGFVFNYVDVKSKNLFNSWIIHILADSAIVLIGLRLFNFI